jgi:phenylacetate-CoA ligase
MAATKKHPVNDRLQFIRGNTEGAAWPPVCMGGNAALAALLYQLEETQWLPRDKITEMQFRQMAALAGHSAKHSPAFGARLEKAGLTPADIATPQGFKRLPLLTRHDIQAAGSELYCKEVPKSHLPVGETNSSGSTGQKVNVRKTALSSLFWTAMALRDHFWQQRDFSLRHAAILPHFKKQAVNPNWGRPANLLFDTGPTLVVPSSQVDVKGQLRLLREFQPQYLIISPSNLAGILDLCEREKAPLTSIRRISTTNETVKDAFRQKVETFFNTKIDDLYSSAEMGYMAMQCPESRLYHVMAENIILEVLDENGQDCAPGQIGRVAVTDLTNFAMPLIRYSLGDYAEVGEACPCGRGLPTIRRFLGRERNLAVHPNGARHWPAIGLIKFHEVADIRQFQFIQHDLETIELRLVSMRPLTPADEEKIRLMVQENLGYAYKVTFTYFDEMIPRSPGGKFEEYICKV